MTTMKDAYHDLFGGSPKHDTVDPMFQAGWNAVIEACGGTDHYVRVTDSGWTLQHPITERLEGRLFDCTMQQLVHIAASSGDLPIGVSKVWLDRKALQWEEVEP